MIRKEMTNMSTNWKNFLLCSTENVKTWIADVKVSFLISDAYLTFQWALKKIPIYYYYCFTWATTVLFLIIYATLKWKDIKIGESLPSISTSEPLGRAVTAKEVLAGGLFVKSDTFGETNK